MGEGKQPVIDGEGHAFLNVRLGEGEVEALVSRLNLRLDDQELRFDVGTIPRSQETIPLDSRSRDVRRFVRRWVYAMRRAATLDAGRNRTITPVPKPVGSGVKRRMATAPKEAIELVPCPRCNGEGRPDCRLCEGAGEITAIMATAWEMEQS